MSKTPGSPEVWVALFTLQFQSAVFKTGDI